MYFLNNTFSSTVFYDTRVALLSGALVSFDFTVDINSSRLIKESTVLNINREEDVKLVNYLKSVLWYVKFHFLSNFANPEIPVDCVTVK